MTDPDEMEPEQREGVRLILSLIYGRTIGEEHPGNTLVDGFTKRGDLIVNGVVISSSDAINAGARLAADLLREHAEDPVESLTQRLHQLTVWEADHAE